MRRVVIILLALFVCTSTFATGKITLVEGDASLIKSSIYAKLEFDYSDLVAVFNGKQYNSDSDWTEMCIKAEDYFIKGWNKKNNRGLQVTPTTSASQYRVIFIVREIKNNIDNNNTGVSPEISGIIHLFDGDKEDSILTIEIDNYQCHVNSSHMQDRIDVLYRFLSLDIIKTLYSHLTIDLSCLNGQNLLNFEVDWTELTIKNLSIEDWIAYRLAEQPECDAHRELEKELKPQVSELVKKFNSKMESVPMVLVVKEGCKYTLNVCPLSFDVKGNNRTRCQIIDNDSQESIASLIIVGNGGRIGTMSNLWGDGFRSVGEKLGEIVNKAMKGEVSY